MRAGRRALAGLNKTMRHSVGCGKIGARVFFKCTKDTVTSSAGVQ